MKNLSRLWEHISNRRRGQLIFLLFLMVLTSLLEMLSVGSVLPFIGALTNPEHLFNNKYLQPIIEQFGFTSPSQMALPFSILFVSATLFAGLIRILLLYVSSYLSQAIGAELSIEIYKRTLYQDYSIHISRNSSEIINGIITKTTTVSDGIINPIMTVIGSFFIIMGLSSILIFIDIYVAFILFFTIGSVYLVIMSLSHKLLDENSNIISIQSNQKIKSLQEGLGAIKEVLLSQAQKFYCNIYRNADLPVRRAFASSAFLGGYPKYAIEGLGMTIVAILAYWITTQNTQPLGAIPVLAAFALGAQRILPALQQIYNAYATYKSSNESFKDVLLLLDQPLPEYLIKGQFNEIPFEDKIEFRNVSFRYSDNSPYILKNINFVIKKGDRVGVTGTTGSGKTTLIDILTGLLPPTEGNIFVDGIDINVNNKHSWQLNISYVPQNVFLTDSSVEENIAFGVSKDKIDQTRIHEAVNEAQLTKVIDGLTNKYQTIIGENGLRISGGQRQRIGIARALYKGAKLIVFDEATNALDNTTEKNVIKSIDTLGKDRTVLMIAHRLSTLSNCNKILELNNVTGLKVTKFNQVNKK